MAKLVYWNIITGNDSYSGLTAALPKRTLAGAYGVAADGDIVLVGPGVYPLSVTTGVGSAFCINKKILLRPYKRGKVIWDFENTSPGGAEHLQINGAVILGMHFRNMAPSTYAIRTLGSDDGWILDCVFYQRDGAIPSGRGLYIRGSASNIVTYAENNTFRDLEKGILENWYALCNAYSNYFVGCTTPLEGSFTHDFNAFPGNTELNGVDSDDPHSNPGFVDAAGEDFRLDPTDGDAMEIFRTQGQFGGRIGSSGASGIFWDPRFLQSRYMAPDPTPGDQMHGLWITDPNYEDPAGAAFTGDIIEDPGSFEPVMDLASNPAALSGRLLGPVFDWGAKPVSVGAVTLSRFRDLPAGAEIDTDTSLPAKLEYRQQATAFLFDDPESTDLPWVEFTIDEQINMTSRYQQVAMTFQAAHTGS